MNLVQLAEHAKNFSNQQLQQMLQQPDGSVPPFILAAEAARRQDIERSAQMQPSQPTTVLDDLIQDRANKAGIGQLPNQIANPQQQPTQMRSGGGVRRFAEGQIVSAGDNTSFMGIQYDPSKDLFGGVPGILEGVKSAWDYSTQPWSESYGPTAPKESGGIESLGEKEMTADIDKYRREVAGGYSKPTTTTVDPAAAEKNKETAKKEAEMGAQPTATATPTTNNSADAAKIRAQIEALYGPQENDNLLGISPTAYAGIAQAMLSREPGLSSGERWAAASMALARDQQAQQEQENELRREGAMALINWDAKQAETARQEQREDVRYEREKADADARAELAAKKAQVDAQKSGFGIYAQIAKDNADSYQKQIDALAKPYTEMGGEPPEEVAKQIADLVAQRDKYMSMYNSYQEKIASGLYGVPPIGETDPTTGRPTS